ncbi:MAG TPA: hypothetical protein VFB21_19120 [Chthonomonadaceae bacterium]|nr:hypothetical protein [Chthonomonadaceae bacterium]
MSGQRGRAAPSSDSQAVPPRVILAAALALVVFLGWMAYRTFGPFTPPKTFTVQDQKAWVAKLARETQGDFDKLSPADQTKLNNISFGNGATYLKKTYEKQR